MPIENRLLFITLECHECSRKSEITYDALEERYRELSPINLANMNQLLERFYCSNCNSRFFSIADKNDEIIFDMQQNVSCINCGLSISFPRISAVPGTNLCTYCKDEAESVNPNEVQFPDVPTGMRGKCPTCETRNRNGIIVVYQNSREKTFFLGCSVFPNCRWSSNQYFDELNRHLES